MCAGIGGMCAGKVGVCWGRWVCAGVGGCVWGRWDVCWDRSDVYLCVALHRSILFQRYLHASERSLCIECCMSQHHCLSP